MKIEDFKKQTEDLQSKIGKEKASLIADNIATLISDNMQVNKILDEKDEEIKKLTEDKENLMTTNMNLLQQIPMSEETKPSIDKKEKEDKRKPYDFRSAFDENGNFVN